MACITYENACRWYSFDPFAHRAKERCTVVASPPEVPDHDMAIRSFDKGRFERKGTGADLGRGAARATA